MGCLLSCWNRDEIPSYVHIVKYVKINCKECGCVTTVRTDTSEYRQNKCYSCYRNSFDKMYDITKNNNTTYQNKPKCKGCYGSVIGGNSGYCVICYDKHICPKCCKYYSSSNSKTYITQQNYANEYGACCRDCFHRISAKHDNIASYYK